MFEQDLGLRGVLGRFGLQTSALLGYGGEATVFALGQERALRVLWQGGDPNGLRARQALVDELVAMGAPFSLPALDEVGEVDGRWYSVERRLRGGPVSDVLATLSGRERDLLVEHYMDATAALGDLHLAPRPYWGELMGARPLRAQTWASYLRTRAAQSLRASGIAGSPEQAEHLAAALAGAFPDCRERSFVHLDAFCGNVLAVGTQISAVIDIGVTAVAGDRRLDPLSGAVYLASPEITPTATARDLEVANSWLRAAGLFQWLAPARDWLAAYWSFALDDAKLAEWCRSILGDRA